MSEFSDKLSEYIVKKRIANVYQLAKKKHL